MIDYSLYVITDKKPGSVSIEEAVRKAIAGGATIVQYREKAADTAEMIGVATELHKITMEAGIPLIINDRVDVALAVDAEGVHVGQEDMPSSVVRKIIGAGKLLGVSVKTVNEAFFAVKEGADYLGVGDIFGTASKKDAGKPIGLEMLKKIAERVSVPIVGIGGITKTNAGSIIENGADGIAVISAIFGKPDPEKEARELLKIIKESR
jgi:thiamine-phosphate diphosphorylase